MIQAPEQIRRWAGTAPLAQPGTDLASNSRQGLLSPVILLSYSCRWQDSGPIVTDPLSLLIQTLVYRPGSGAQHPSAVLHCQHSLRCVLIGAVSIRDGANPHPLQRPPFKLCPCVSAHLCLNTKLDPVSRCRRSVIKLMCILQTHAHTLASWLCCLRANTWLSDDATLHLCETNQVRCAKNVCVRRQKILMTNLNTHTKCIKLSRSTQQCWRLPIVALCVY